MRLSDINLKKIIFLMGPTASGKTNLALYLCDNLPIEIISVDSGQIFRGLNIGTAKPDIRIQKKFPHHLIDIIDPTERYSAARFREDSLEKIQEIQNRNKIPILVGGTMMYFKFLQDGCAKLPSADRVIRKHIDDEAKSSSWPNMHKLLTRLDPLAANKINPNDSQRIQRALEVYYITGTPLSELQRQGEDKAQLDILKLAIAPKTLDLLTPSIDQRFKRMFDQGLIDEVIDLRKNFLLNKEMPSMKCVGYRQAWDYLDGQINKNDFLEKGITATRQLAKRQITWLRADTIKIFDNQSRQLFSETLGWIKKNLDS